MTALLILMLVLLAIACRGLFSFCLPIWVLVLAGALAALALGTLSLVQALAAINVQVLIYLFAVFVIAEGLRQSGYLMQLSERAFQRPTPGWRVLLYVVAFGSLGSIILMNDTIAILGTLAILEMCPKKDRMQQPLLLALAFSVTTGSVASPIGNPQNLLIALQANMTNPFLVFFGHLTVPTLLNLAIAYALLWFVYRRDFQTPMLCTTVTPLQDRKLAILSLMSLALLVALMLAHTVLSLFVPSHLPPLSVLALCAALPVLLASSKRMTIVRGIDWGSLIFFAALFVLVQSVWQGQTIQHLLQRNHLPLTDSHLLLLISTLMSVVISNVPWVALCLPLLTHVGASTANYLALSIGSTLAGNLLLFGAASNIIIVQNTERQRRHAPSFLAFARIGIPLTLLQSLVFLVFL